MKADFQTHRVAERYRQWLREQGWWFARITTLPRGYRVESGPVRWLP